MLIAILLAIIALTLIILTFFLGITSFRSIKAIQQIQVDVNQLTSEARQVLNKVGHFIDTDLSSISQETHQALRNINNLSEDVTSKIDSVNFLFRPLNFLNSKLDSKDHSDHESSSTSKTVPQILKWIASSVFLIKTTKEFLKHDK